MRAARTTRARARAHAQEARRYHISLQVLAPGQAPVGVVALDSGTYDAVRPDQVHARQLPYACARA